MSDDEDTSGTSRSTRDWSEGWGGRRRRQEVGVGGRKEYVERSWTEHQSTVHNPYAEKGLNKSFTSITRPRWVFECRVPVRFRQDPMSDRDGVSDD